jgi:glycosyltransferase involved in cell wall biosynthesis
VPHINPKIQEEVEMKCTVVVPTYNRLNSLKDTIKSLLHQDFPDLEIIIVDDGSTDGTSIYLDKIKRTRGLSVIHQINKGPAAARNSGIREAKGDIIAFTDDDCVVPPDWVSRITKEFKDPIIGFIGGLAVNRVKGNFFSEISQELSNHFVRFKGGKGQSTSFLTSNNIAYRSEVLRKINGFNECFRRPGGEEQALNHCILNLGLRGVLIPDLVIEHYHNMNLRGLLKQQRNYGRGAFVLFKIIAPGLEFPPSPIPMAAHLSLTGAWIKQNPVKGMLKILFYFIITSQIAAGYFLESFSQLKKKSPN